MAHLTPNLQETDLMNHETLLKDLEKYGWLNARWVAVRYRLRYEYADRLMKRIRPLLPKKSNKIIRFSTKK